MNKNQNKALIKSVWNYLGRKITESFENKDEVNFDWYSEGQEVFLHLIRDTPIKVTPRVKSL